MFDRATEEANLALVNQHMAETEKRIGPLKERMDLLTSHGGKYGEESRFLALLQESLKILQHRRALLAQRLNDNP